MSLIDRYVYAATRTLNPSMQEDVAKELRATINDSLEAKGSHSKKHVNEVLVELGDPEILAAQYKNTKAYLIGPELFYVYVKVLKIVLSVSLPVAFAFNFIINLGTEAQPLIDTFGAALANTVIAGLHTLFWVTLLFFVFERTSVNSKELTKDIKAWSPEKLPQVPEKYQIPVSESMTSLISYALLAISPVIAPMIVAAHTDNGRVEFFSPELWSNWTVVIVTAGVIGILLSLWKIIAKKWSTGLVVANTLFGLGSIGILLAVLFTTPVVSEAFTQFILTSTPDVTIEQVQQWVTWGVGISFIASIGFYLFDIVKSIWIKTQSRRIV